MARDTVNPEGLTFEEWVCAAGVAVPDHRMNPMESWRAWPWVMPYSQSDTYYDPWVNPIPGTVLLVGHGQRMPLGKKRTRTTTFYSKKIREAWRNGEDPTEWRAG